MNGHTSNRILRACLKSQYLDSRRRRDTEEGTDRDYWEGKMANCVEIGILMEIIGREEDLQVPPASSPPQAAA